MPRRSLLIAIVFCTWIAVCTNTPARAGNRGHPAVTDAEAGFIARELLLRDRQFREYCPWPPDGTALYDRCLSAQARFESAARMSAFGALHNCDALRSRIQTRSLGRLLEQAYAPGNAEGRHGVSNIYIWLAPLAVCLNREHVLSAFTWEPYDSVDYPFFLQSMTGRLTIDADRLIVAPTIRAEIDAGRLIVQAIDADHTIILPERSAYSATAAYAALTFVSRDERTYHDARFVLAMQALYCYARYYRVRQEDPEYASMTGRGAGWAQRMLDNVATSVSSQGYAPDLCEPTRSERDD